MACEAEKADMEAAYLIWLADVAQAMISQAIYYAAMTAYYACLYAPRMAEGGDGGAEEAEAEKRLAETLARFEAAICSNDVQPVPADVAKVVCLELELAALDATAKHNDSAWATQVRHNFERRLRDRKSELTAWMDQSSEDKQ